MSVICMSQKLVKVFIKSFMLVVKRKMQEKMNLLKEMQPHNEKEESQFTIPWNNYYYIRLIQKFIIFCFFNVFNFIKFHSNIHILVSMYYKQERRKGIVHLVYNNVMYCLMYCSLSLVSSPFVIVWFVRSENEYFQ